MSKNQWQRTSVQNLLKNSRSGRFYGRWTISVNGKSKQVWRKLDTDVFTVAKLRLNDESSKIEALRGSRSAVSAGKGLVADLFKIYEERTKANTDIKPASITARLVAVAKIRKTWPQIEALKWSKVTQPAVASWIARFKAEGTGFVPPGAKTAQRGNSASSVNRALDALRQIMEIAVETGAIHKNPVFSLSTETGLRKKAVREKWVPPARAQVNALFVAMETNGSIGGHGAEAADFCRFLLMSGARVGEVPVTMWKHVDWDRDQVNLPGFKTETSERYIPLFPALALLLRKLQERRKSAARFHADGETFLGLSDSLFKIKECQKTIDAACKRVGMPRITHHDFRHLFATMCIESGVDIPTVSKWLGHSDGGALAMKTYGHLRQEHSAMQAAKVNFGSNDRMKTISDVKVTHV